LAKRTTTLGEATYLAAKRHVSGENQPVDAFLSEIVNAIQPPLDDLLVPIRVNFESITEPELDALITTARPTPPPKAP